MLMTMKEPPPVGSPRELLLILLWLQKEQMEHAQMYAIMKGIVDKDNASEAFDNYKKVRFPWIETTKTREKMQDIKRLMEEIKSGPMTVTPLWQQKLRSRTKTRILERQEPLTPAQAETMKNVYAKIGNTVPIR